jgi:hypothetical protein
MGCSQPGDACVTMSEEVWKEGDDDGVRTQQLEPV